MSIALSDIAIRHERRLRLVFTNTVDVGAFNPARYAVTSQDDVGASPAVVAVYAVASSPNIVELALGADLAPGGAYAAAVDAVPAIDASVTPVGAMQLFSYPAPASSLNTEVTEDDIDALLYSVDLAYDGAGYVETAEGDLALSSGVENVRRAVERAGVSEPLSWDGSYGANVRAYVDGPTPILSTLLGRLQRQALRDDRVASASVRGAASLIDDVGEVRATIDIVPIGQKTAIAAVFPISSRR